MLFFNLKRVETVGASCCCQEGEEERCGENTDIASLGEQVPTQGSSNRATAKDNNAM
jgi:hypothetical protein